MAIGFYVEKGIWQGWNTKGWVAIAPHDSVMLLPDSIAGNAYSGHIVGCDQRYEGSCALFVHPFSVANAARPI